MMSTPSIVTSVLAVLTGARLMSWGLLSGQRRLSRRHRYSTLSLIYLSLFADGQLDTQ